MGCKRRGGAWRLPRSYLRSDLLDEPEQDVGCEGALVRLIEDNGSVPAKVKHG